MSTGFDYIIVGGGSAGCVAAWRLVKERQAKVLLLERGPARASGFSRFLLPMPAAWMKGIGGSDSVELHVPVPQKHLNGRSPKIGQANILGGGTSVNAMVYTRGQAEDYDNWDRFLGTKGKWSYAEMLKHFRSMEYNHDFNNEYHGVGGPLHVSGTGARCQATEDYILAAQGLGIPFNPDFNGKSQGGVGTMQYTTRARRRWNGVDAFLSQIKGDKNFTLETDALVTSLIVEGKACKGVTYQWHGQTRTAYCNQEVLIAAGCYNTPKLLMLSGIGPESELKSHGIQTKFNLPGVGENLQDHHEVPVVSATNGHFGYDGEDKGLRAIRNGLQYLLFKTGPVTSVGVEACAYIDPDGGKRPTIKMYCVPSVYLDADVAGPKPKDGVTLNACLLRPKSRGTVKLRSTDPHDKPVVDNNYLGDPDDLRLEIEGLKFAREILKQKPLADRITYEVLPGKDVTSKADLAEHCRRTVKTNWHPVGTARMGKANDKMAVLDTDLKVRGITGLRVIDASAMPFIPSGNTNAPVLALASRAISLL
ncbi:GMC family oxidoreductase [Aestuariivirga litoralis]|uniref:GMC family oxidoreductase n=1 Tax=Aestuariivirga litoralis TaxID=2650924 RepID=UPI0018C7CB8B|nr:FAD-dependent oxidoreductase [Aestuariivirga litoralis]MBG1232540.1 FAD-dependent oxidoreductase [Aestuariivirga litoralis]